MQTNESWAPVFDADRRKVTFGNDLSVLENVGAQLNAYGLHEGDELKFPESITIGTQEPRREGQRSTYLVSAIINGVKTWLNPMFFLRTKREDGVTSPIYPKWAALGDAKGVVSKLVEMGGIKVPKKSISVQIADFNSDGTAKMVPELNNKGEVVTNADGSARFVRATRSASYPVLPDPTVE